MLPGSRAETTVAPSVASSGPKYSRLPALGGWLARTIASTSCSPSMRSTITSMRPPLSLRPASRAWMTRVSLNTSRLPGAMSSGRSASRRSTVGTAWGDVPAVAVWGLAGDCPAEASKLPGRTVPAAGLSLASGSRISVATSSSRPPARCSGGYCAISSSGR